MTIATIAQSAPSHGECARPRSTIRIVEESVLRPARSEPLFQTFVDTVANSVQARALKITDCHNGDGPEIILTFVHRPLVDRAAASSRQTGPRQTARDQPGIGSDRGDPACVLESPWLRLWVWRAPTPRIEAMIVWSERQMLLDQALLAGPTGAGAGPLLPMAADELAAFVDLYTREVLLAPSPEARAQAKAAMTGQIPTDILWLFQQAWQSTFAPFGMEVDDARGAVIRRSAKGYGALVTTLAAQCPLGSQASVQYHDIRGLAGLFPLEQYRIVSLH